MVRKRHSTKSNIKATGKANPMWGGHYSVSPADILQKINASIDFDKALYRQDIRGSKAHAQMLAKQGIISSSESAAIVKGLTAIEKEIDSGAFTFDVTLEDIHMHIEARLKTLIGAAAGKLHTARSRNDQVATSFRLWVRDAIDALDAQLQQLQSSLLDRAEEYTATIMPGFTHLQNAQPVTLGHHLLAYVDMLGRDRSRLFDTRVRLNESPLGAAALAGTPFPIDREVTAQSLGFDKPMSNSLDAVSDRDFALDYLYSVSVLATHLSRLAEEFVLWSGAQFGFITLSEEFTTGSSIMPQKRNPDAAELVRGKTGRLFGHLLGLLTVMKGLPLAYSKDLQEDKEPLFDAAATVSLCVQAMNGMVKDFSANKTRLLDAAAVGYSTATDLADWLVQHTGIPFRESHALAGKAVKLAESKRCGLHELSLKELQKIAPGISKNIYSVLTPEASVKSRRSFGGTAPGNVKTSINTARKRYL